MATNAETLPPDAVALLRMMMRIRVFEDRFARRSKPGFQLFSAGEEAVAVGVAAVLDERDQLLSSGRSLGPALARGLKPEAVLAELLGKVTGPCRGKGGRGHLAQPTAGFFGAHAVVGGNLGVAAGVALAFRKQAAGRVAVCLFGDGACGAGALHETLNLAAVWRLPLVFICANNQYSVSSPVREMIAAHPLSRLAEPFGIPSRTVDGMDVLTVREAAREAVERARAGGGPGFLECVTYRFHSHSNAVRDTRPPEEVAAWRLRCPIAHLANRLRAAGLLESAHERELDREIDDEMDEAIRTAENAPFPDPSTEALADVE